MSKISDEAILILLLQGYSQRQISAELKATPTTISRRIKKPEFKNLLSEYRQRILDNTATLLTSNSEKAANTLIRLLDSDNELTKYNAASKILSYAENWITLNDLQQRLDTLENTVSE